MVHWSLNRIITEKMLVEAARCGIWKNIIKIIQQWWRQIVDSVITDPTCGTAPVTGRCPRTKGQWYKALMISLLLSSKNFSANAIPLMWHHCNEKHCIKLAIKWLLRHAWMREIFWQAGVLLVFWDAMAIIWRHSDDLKIDEIFQIHLRVCAPWELSACIKQIDFRIND